MGNMIIRDDVDKYMERLRKQIRESENIQPEEMSAFFTNRIDTYEEHMAQWNKAYDRLAELLPDYTNELLDLGCGTGLELKGIFERFPYAYVTGIDVCRPMIERLELKYQNKNLELICADYFKRLLPTECYDAVISFESLHHFGADRKRHLYEKVLKSICPNGYMIEADYFACCDEEEQLLKDYAERMRLKWNIKEPNIHIDTPLTIEKELGVLRIAGFVRAEVVETIDGVTFIVARKGK